MTTEDDFRRALEADRADRTLRLVFADWLQDRDDPRAEGYRAVARLPQIDTVYVPQTISFEPMTVWFRAGWILAPNEGYPILPLPWFGALDGYVDQSFADGRLVYENSVCFDAWRNYATPFAAEDAAARAFIKLPPDVRAQLLGDGT